MSRKDHTGLKYGKLTGAKYLETVLRNKKYYSLWLWHCDCGNNIEKFSCDVVTGNCKSCGCLKIQNLQKRSKDITGKRFGNLIAVKRLRRSEKHPIWIWELLCDCGNTTEGSLNILNSGKKKTCGCRMNRRGKSPRRINYEGYALIYKPEYSTLNDGYILEHRYVMEQHLNRRMLSNENVHHKNGVRDDNRLENLEIWSHAQPYGQRVEDKVAFALEILKLYAPEKLGII